MRAHRFLPCALALVILDACSLFVSLDGLTGGSESDGGEETAVGDVSSRDSQVDSGGDVDVMGNDGSDTGPTSNLVEDPGFESGSNGCGGNWSAGYGATYRLSPVAHSGSESCMVCPLTSGEISYALQNTNPIALGAGTYVAKAWIHSPVDAGASGAAGVLAFDNLLDGGLIYHQGTQVTPDTTWVLSTETFTLTQATKESLQLHVYEVDNGCVLVDDLSLAPQ